MDVFRAQRVPDGAWERLLGEARAKDEVSDRVGWTRRWSADFNLLGLVGEWLYGRLIGEERTAGFGDGGRDFGVTDVKASAWFSEPLLRLSPDDPLRAEFYALVAVDLDGRRARYAGYATRADIRAAPLRQMGRHRQARALEEGRLRRFLAPPAASGYARMRLTADVLYYAEAGRARAA